MIVITVYTQIMFKCKADYTITFRELSEISLEDLESAKYPKVVWLAMYATYILLP